MTHPLAPVLLSLVIGSGSFAVLAGEYAAKVRAFVPAPAPDVAPPPEPRKPEVPEPANPGPKPVIGPAEPPAPIKPKEKDPLPLPPSNAPPKISSATKEVPLPLNGGHAVVLFDVSDRETLPAGLRVTATAEPGRVAVSVGPVERAANGLGGTVRVALTSGWVSGADKVVVTVTDGAGATAAQVLAVTIAPGLPDGADWTGVADQKLVLVAASNLNDADLKALRDELGKLDDKARARLLGGDVFVVGPGRVWPFAAWAGAAEREFFAHKDPEQAFADTFAGVGAALAGIRAGRDPKAVPALVLWHSLSTPQQVPPKLVELAAARLQWTGEREAQQLQNKPAAAFFPLRVDAYGPEIKELGEAVRAALAR